MIHLALLALAAPQLPEHVPFRCASQSSPYSNVVSIFVDSSGLV